MSVYVKQGGKHWFPKSRGNMLVRQKQVSSKVIFLLICVSEKCHMYLGDDGAKELVLMCDHVDFSHKNKWTEDFSERGGAVAKPM